MKLTAIVGATVIDGTGAEPVPDGVVLIENDTIRSVSRRADTAIPDQAEVLDATGAYLIPGMMDANVHLVATITPDLALQYEGRYEDVIAEAAQVCLAAGFTTVFDTWGPAGPLSRVRDRIARGEIPGSRIFLAGNIVGFDGPLSPDFFDVGDLFSDETRRRINHEWAQGVGADLAWLPAETLRDRVREYIESTGVDFVKYAANDHLGRGLIAFSLDAQRVIVEEGHRAGMTVQAHTISVEGLRMEIEAGADILQHGNLTGPESIPESTLRLLVERQLPIAALYFTNRYREWAAAEGRAGLHPNLFTEQLEHTNRRLIQAGANLLLTTDISAWGRTSDHPRLRVHRDAPPPRATLGEAHVAWLTAVIERGMTPMDALVSATRKPAEAYSHPELGRIASGRKADLVLLDADPLADPQNYLRVRGVMKEGVSVALDSLPSPRVLTDDPHRVER
jgi:imidazolonepropionase-like amidohydrolase